MCRSIESIRILNGNIENISWHNNRFNATRSSLFGIEKKTYLEDLIIVPEKHANGEVKCRLIYKETIESIEFETYNLRPVHSLKMVTDNNIEYNYKYFDRSLINNLFVKKGKEDDILIIKNGLVTDSSYCNLVFSDGTNLFTPSSPLLKGTKREKYLFEGKIKQKEIYQDEIFRFKELHMINAFLDLGRLVIPINNIIPEK